MLHFTICQGRVKVIHQHHTNAAQMFNESRITPYSSQKRLSYMALRGHVDDLQLIFHECFYSVEHLSTNSAGLLKIRFSRDVQKESIKCF